MSHLSPFNSFKQSVIPNMHNNDFFLCAGKIFGLLTPLPVAVWKTVLRSTILFKDETGCKFFFFIEAAKRMFVKSKNSTFKMQFDNYLNPMEIHSFSYLFLIFLQFNSV